MIDNTIQRFYPMGNKTLVMITLRKSFFVFVLLVILIAGLFFLAYVPSESIGFALYVFLGYLMIVVLTAMISFFLGWLEYSRYEITLGDRNLKMQRGIISVEQVGIPYRYIQDIKIERNLLSQIMGVSDLRITLSGSDQEEIHPGEVSDMNLHRIVLPALEDRIANQIQEIILNRSQVQQIDVRGNGAEKVF